jgi:hypothetical protein|eukprot:Tamp_23851.p2 GENE.Tamp_23851~~Tamp_23851.p2  ORF type:complete len:270 (-),score=45.74 Tamp_23851:207-965(-)
MPGEIEVIGAGLGRTGTLSLKAALDILGYQTYHFVHPPHAKMWAEFSQGRAGSDAVLDLIVQSGHNATCDNPACDLYEEQLKKYPAAKVILTVRDDGARWARSWQTLMAFIEVQERPFSWRYPTFIQWIPFMRHWKTMRSLMGTHFGLPPGELIRGWRSKPDPAAWLAQQYEAHNAKVRATVPAPKLLVFNVKEGWAPLCKFLGREIPDQPFPNVNEAAELERAATIMIVLSYLWVPTLASLVAGSVWLYRR